MIEAFQEGGWFMWVVLATLGVALATGLVALTMAFGSTDRQPGLAVSGFALAFSVLVPVSGFVGYALAMQNATSVIAMVDPSQRVRLLAEAISEAMNLVVFGLGGGALAFLPAAVAFLRAVTRPRAPKP